MKYEDAGIKSKQEAALRILSGESLCYNGLDLCFIEGERNEGLSTPFRWGSTSITPEVWDSFEDWETKLPEPKWYEDIPEHGVLVRSATKVYLAKSYSDGWVDTDGVAFFAPKHLTPLSDEEIKKFLRGE